jgi:hypothetical protein
MNAQKAQIRTASVAIGIEPKSAHNGGTARVIPRSSMTQRYKMDDGLRGREPK